MYRMPSVYDHYITVSFPLPVPVLGCLNHKSVPALAFPPNLQLSIPFTETVPNVDLSPDASETSVRSCEPRD